MSCKDCDEFQKSTGTSYFRWGTANIEVRACMKHLEEVYGALRAALAFTGAMKGSLRPSPEVLKPHACPTCNGFGTLAWSQKPCPDCSTEELIDSIDNEQPPSGGPA